MKALLRALPDVVRFVGRLLTDSGLPRPAKLALAAAVLYLASPLDLIPDFIPFVGYLDDVLVAAVVVDGILNYVDRALIVKHWPGSIEWFDRLAGTARLLARWVPGRVKQRIFGRR
jgi:uncharacterized membrane protein YkvA (DUF1232 family)